LDTRVDSMDGTARGRLRARHVGSLIRGAKALRRLSQGHSLISTQNLRKADSGGFVPETNLDGTDSCTI
jgi:hypothetical protein